MADDTKLSEHEITQVSTLLAKLEPGFLPFAIFHQVTRLAAMPIVEVVPLRVSANGRIEVLLLLRETDDPVWPGQLHVPGTVVRATDTPGSFDAPLQRVLSKELTGTRTSEPHFVKSILHYSGRGMEVSQVYWVEVQSEPVEGVFYDAEDLPDTIVRSQLDFISDTIAHFTDYHRS